MNFTSVDLKGIYWVETISKEDILKWFEVYDWWFKCIILNKEESASEYYFLLDFTEEHGEEFDGMVLLIYEKIQGQFTEFILPRLQEIFNNNIEVVDILLG